MNPQDIQAPSSPLGNFPELANMYRSSFQLPLSQAQLQPQSYNDQIALANQKSSQAAAASQQAAAADPNNFRAVPTDDGGLKFYDPTGQEITAAQYASVKGTTPAAVLKTSTNPIDIGYQKDFKDLQDYINLKLQSKNDPDAAEKAGAIEQDVKKNLGIDIKQLKPDQLIQAFKIAYPTIYGQGGFQGPNTAGVKSGTTFIPQATSGLVDSYASGGTGGIQ